MDQRAFQEPPESKRHDGGWVPYVALAGSYQAEINRRERTFNSIKQLTFARVSQ